MYLVYLAINNCNENEMRIYAPLKREYYFVRLKIVFKVRLLRLPEIKLYERVSPIANSDAAYATNNDL